jgi:LPXTG-motif cell wall-anchored protein
MTCLPNTGLDAPVLVVLAAGAAFALVGLAVLWRARRSGAGAALLLLVVVAVGAGVSVGLAAAPPAFADCNHDNGSDSHNDTDPDSTATTEPEVTETVIEPEVDNSLTITQTSTMDDLRPGAEPKPIAGIVVNNGPDDTFVTAIVVSIEAVDRSDDAVPGRCDATDYVLLDVHMPVGETLGPYGGTAVFKGAAIGLTNKSTNQDACQGATVTLRYVTSSI